MRHTPPQKDWLDVDAMILEVIALVRSEVERHRVSLQTHLSPDVPRVLGDRIQLQQVLLNLLMNAIEALSGVDEGERELRVSSGTHASHGVLVAVQDSGIGIDPEHVDRLFNAFFTTKPQGMGLGLAISHSIIEGARRTSVGLSQPGPGRDLSAHPAPAQRPSGMTGGGGRARRHIRQLMCVSSFSSPAFRLTRLVSVRDCCPDGQTNMEKLGISRAPQ